MKDKFSLRRQRYFDRQEILTDTRHTRTSNRIYENGKLDVKIRHTEPQYRFEGVVTDNHWSISDIPAVWPEIDEIETQQKNLEHERGLGRKCRVLKRKVEAMAAHVDFESMRQPA